MDQFLKTHHLTFNGTMSPLEADALLCDVKKRLRGTKCLEKCKKDMAIFQLQEGVNN